MLHWIFTSVPSNIGQITVQVWHHITMVAKYLDFINLRWQYRNLHCWTMKEKYVLPVCRWVQSCRGKSTICQFFIFFLPYLPYHGLLRSKNFATMATWRDDSPFPCGHSSFLFEHISLFQALVETTQSLKSEQEKIGKGLGSERIQGIQIVRIWTLGTGC